jgi:hypothetical protein
MRQLSVTIVLLACAACIDEANPAPPQPAESGELPDSIGRAIITAGIAPVKDAAVVCGEAAPAIRGFVKIHIRVAPDGSVTEATVATAPDAALGECVAAAARRSTYAKTKRGGSFLYPFVF